MDSQFERDRAKLKFGNLRPADGAPPPPAAAAAAKPVKKDKKVVPKSPAGAGGFSKAVGSGVRTPSAAAAGGVKKLPVGMKAPKVGGKVAAGKEKDPLAMAKAEIATLNKELQKEREQTQARIDAITEAANQRIDEYDITFMRLERELADKTRTIAERDEQIIQIEQDRDNRIAKLERERDARYAQYEEYLMIGEKTRAELHNALIELKGNIRVFARVRPLLPREVQAKVSSTEHYEFPEGTDHRGLNVMEVPANAGVLGKNANVKTMPFTFDKVFDQSAQQQTIFDEISQLVQSALDGYKVCIFAYGQTGSGKTYTMEGPEPGKNSSSSGMIPRAVRQIFDNCKWKSKQSGFKYKLLCSFIQIYNETIHDLMNPADMYQVGPGKEPLKHEIRNTETESIVTDIKEVEVTDEQTVFKLLQKAQDNRKTAGTKLNEVSSRSHSIFIMKIKGWNEATQQEMNGQLNLIDLAGSERLAKSQAEGDRLKETQHINKSLACLGDVIAALGKGAAAVPFRQSKLTHVLQPSMTNQSKTLMFVNINPLPEHLNESICSLRFAAKVNAVEIGIAKKKVVTKENGAK
eukprot:TRINITY_DN988_c3_g1_i1.p2 TRINITY_DN988_c3_g1~~TRINITY_DN988_c3_g1_i1.p2  ORF type:complete len:578 (+),score=269.36 TRINITY_DN988_c3_g1_i1:52-1785(+)